MNDKEKRLKQLTSQTYLSDQEYAEKDKLEDELRLEHQEEMINSIVEGPKEIIPKRKRSILEIIIQKIKPKPATFEEIQQLKLDRQRAILKRDIAKANYDRKNLGRPRQEHRITKTRKTSQGQKSSSDGGLRKMIGNNDSRSYKDLTS